MKSYRPCSTAGPAGLAPFLPFRPHESTYPFPARRLHPDDRSGRLASRRETGAPAHARRDEHGRRAAELPRRSGAVQRARIGPRLPAAAPGREAETDRTAIYPRIKRMADGRYILFVQEGRSPPASTTARATISLHWSDTQSCSNLYAVRLPRAATRAASRPSMPSCWPTATCSPPARSAPRRATNTTSAAESCSQKPRQRSHLVRRRGHLRRHQLGTLSASAARRTHSVLLHRLPARHPQFGDLGDHLHGQRPHLARTHARLPAVQVYDDKGVRIFTDQMPCFRLLNDGETLSGSSKRASNPTARRAAAST